MSKQAKAPKDGGRVQSYRAREEAKDRKRREIYATDEEWVKVRKMLKELREI